MQCPECKSEIPEEYRFCLQCGTDLNEITIVRGREQPPPTRQLDLPQTIAAVLPKLGSHHRTSESAPLAQFEVSSEKSNRTLWLFVAISLCLIVIALLIVDIDLSTGRENEGASSVSPISSPSPVQSPSPSASPLLTPSFFASEVSSPQMPTETPFPSPSLEAPVVQTTPRSSPNLTPTTVPSPTPSPSTSISPQDGLTTRS